MANGTETIITVMEREWPRWMIWCVPRAVGPPTWCARPWDLPDAANVINAGSAQWLAEAIAEADPALPAGDYARHKEAGLAARRFGWPWTIEWDPAAREFTARHSGREPDYYPDVAAMTAALEIWRAAIMDGP